MPVVDFEGLYEVSDQGRVQSLTREVPWTSIKGTRYTKRLIGKVLSPIPVTGGHLYVPLCREGVVYRRGISFLVLEAFVERRPEGKIALHWDDDPANNWVGNLRWGTHEENQYDTVRNGNHHNVKKTECPRHHPYTPENTYLTKSGSRTCKTCYRERARERYHRNK